MQGDQVQKFYTEDSQSYDERWLKKGGGYSNRSQIKIVTELTRDWKNRKVLEVGCGSGRFSVLLAGANPEMTFLDLSDAMLQMTLARVGGNHKGLNASVYDIPLLPRSMEAALSINVFNHVDDLAKALSEVNRVLVNGGEFIVNFNNLRSYFFFAGLMVNRKGKSIGRDVYSHWDKPRDFFALLEKHNFRVQEVAGNVFVPLSLDLPVIREFLIFLDKISRHSFLRLLSPSVFVKCVKTGDLTA